MSVLNVNPYDLPLCQLAKVNHLLWWTVTVKFDSAFIRCLCEKIKVLVMGNRTGFCSLGHFDTLNNRMH